MNKIVILVGHINFDYACSDMFNTAKILKDKHDVRSKISACISDKRYILDTPNCTVNFVSPSSNLSWIKADAMYCEDSFAYTLEIFCKPDADKNPKMNLIDYICQVEHVCNAIKVGDGESAYPTVPPYLLQNAIYGKFAPYSMKSNTVEEVFNDLLKQHNESKNFYINMGRQNGKTMLKQAFLEYYDHLKYSNTPISQKLKETAEYYRKDEEAMYIKQDVDVTSFLYKNFNMPRAKLPEIKNVIFNEPATIVIWADGTKTVVQCQEGDIYDPEKGLAMAISKKILGNKHDYYHTFKHWLKRYKKEDK